MGLFGILVALILLIFLAYRGWSVILLSPAAALLAAFLAGEPLLAHWRNAAGKSHCGPRSAFEECTRARYPAACTGCSVNVCTYH